MENNLEFIKVVENIKKLEQQLLGLDSGAYLAEAEREVKEHFARCVNALAARQDVLLKEIHENYNLQNSVRNELNNSVNMQKKILETGQYIYNTDIKTAETIWKGIDLLPHPQVTFGRINIDLPNSIMPVIETHGKVLPNTVATKDATTNKSKPYEVADKIEVFLANFTKKQPHGICWNPNEKCFYFCDIGDNTINKFNVEGKGNLGRHTLQNKYNRPMNPFGIAIHYATKTLYVSVTQGDTIYKLTATGQEILESYRSNFNIMGFIGAWNMTIDQTTETLFISNSQSHNIVKLPLPRNDSWFPDHILAGSKRGFADGVGKAAQFDFPSGLLFDELTQSLLVCDEKNYKLRWVSMTGVVSTLCEIEAPANVAAAGNGFLVMSHGPTPKLFNVTREGVVKLVQSATEKTCVFARSGGLAVHEDSNSCFFTEPRRHNYKNYLPLICANLFVLKFF